MSKILEKICISSIIFFVFNIQAAELNFQNIQLPVVNRTPTDISIIRGDDGQPSLVYKLTDSETPGDINSSKYLINEWSDPAATGLLNQSDFTLFGGVQLTNASTMVLVRGDDTDYAKLFGLSKAPDQPKNDTDQILPDINNEALIDLLTNNQRLFYSLKSRSGWSEPQAIPDSRGALKAVLVAGDNNTALVVFAKDTDNNESTIDDIELYYAIYSQGAWRQPTRLTNNGYTEYSYKASYFDEKFFITWMQDEDGSFLTNDDNRLVYTVVTPSGTVAGSPTNVHNHSISRPVYAVGTDNTDLIIMWSTQLQDKTFKLAETRFNGAQWSEMQRIDISAPDFNNAKLLNYAGNTLLVYQHGNNINIAKYVDESWQEITVIDILGNKRFTISEITFDIINDALWVAYAGHVPVVNETDNLNVGGGLYVASYPLTFDLALRKIVPLSNVMNIGEATKLLFEVRNEGLNNSPRYDIEMRVNGEMLQILDGDVLQAGTSKVLVLEVTPSSAETDVGFNIVSLGKDGDLSNNSKELRIAIKPDFYIKDVTKIDSTHIQIDVREIKGIAASSVELKAYLQVAGVQTELATATYDPTSMGPVVMDIESLANLDTDYKVLVKVNPEGLIVEDNYANNFSVYSYTEDTKADYMVKNMRVTYADVEFKVVNTGKLNSAPVDLLITDDPLQAIAKTALTDPWYHQSVTLDAHGELNVKISRANLPQVNGQYLYVVINPYGVIDESNRNNNSLKDLVVSVTLPSGGDQESPSVPSNFQASNISENTLTLTWGDSTDNVAVSGYRIYRDSLLVSTTTSTSYTDTGLSTNTSYQYTIQAYDTSDNYSESAEITASTRAVKTPSLGCSDPSESPVILFTDIVSGPITTGENNNGAYLSIFGCNFGLPSDLGTNTKVYLNDREVADYKYLGNSRVQLTATQAIQQLTVQVGAVGNPANGSHLPIKLTYNGVTSNTDHSFTVQPGTVRYVSKDGSDTNPGTFEQPFRHVQNADLASGAWGVSRPGDFIVIKETAAGDGTFEDVGYDNGTSSYFCRFRANANPHGGGTVPNGTPGNGYLTLMGYPGHDITIKLPNTHPAGGSRPSGIFVGSASAFENEGRFIVISGLHLIGDSRAANWSAGDGPVNGQTNADHWRVVNNEIEWPTGDPEARSAGIVGQLIDAHLYGNYIHDIGGANLNHGFYIDGYSDNTHIAYNHVSNIAGNLYQSHDSIGATGSNIGSLYIHNNIMHGGGRYGINIGAGTTASHVYNNVVYNTTLAGLRFADMASGGKFMVKHNTFYNVNISPAKKNNYGVITHDSSDRSIIIENNIFYAAPTARHYYAQNTANTNSIVDNNLWYGIPGGSVPIQDSAKGIHADPEFTSLAVNAEDFSLRSTSAAINRGKAISEPVDATILDFVLNARDSSSDIGAYEYNP
jgi:hypothetical protein